jgi:multidrug efflux system membrane fusion protein
VTGRVGLRQVDVGNYVQLSDSNGIVVITQLHPITVLFTIPEDNLPEVLKRVHGGATLTVTALDRADSTTLATGVLSTLDNQIDTTTGTVKLRAQFDNADETLFPNQFVNIRLLVDTLRGAVVVPASAIERGAPGTYVYTVKPDQTVSVTPVTLGPSSGERVAVTKGLAVGTQIVVDGADKLRDGAKIVIAARAAAASASNPTASSETAPATAQPDQSQGGPDQTTPAQPAPAQTAPNQTLPGQATSGQSPWHGGKGHHHRHHTGEGSGQDSGQGTGTGQGAGDTGQGAAPSAQ